MKNIGHYVEAGKGGKERHTNKQTHIQYTIYNIYTTIRVSRYYTLR